ncbi:hypothetical protein QI155_00585 [Thermodesulfovibrio sp. 1176]|uniref:hypothetical protein n=1 Tax=Thermodesulfovibrio sp. 1176 TaxID=3043424 RepID=UPI0024823250|nr:hypothetical protein [Thermodesulfovibrio sp. 1176]MDI1471034.1 hypothetical protein [Thermodesulfovibrio sp. 1176]
MGLISQLNKPIMFIFITIILFVNSSYAQKTGVDENIIKNFTYHIKLEDTKIAFKNGKYESEGSLKGYIKAWIVKYAFADINKDDKMDAVVILAHTGGGSGTFFELTALITERENIKQTNSLLLGDRVEINDIKIVDEVSLPRTSFKSSKKIYLTMKTHKTDDPSCCPSEVVRECFYLTLADEIKSCEDESAPVVKKPAIYLYPKNNENITVKLNIKGNITKTIPEYNESWKVKVDKKGIIDNKYSYLFYEASLESPVNVTKEGWIVKYEHLESWFEKYLPKLGLNRKEIKDFKDYWLKELKYAKFYEIRLLDRDFLDNNMQLLISPKPDTVIRVILYFKPVDKYRKIKNPKLTQIQRKGFTLVEWGGITTDKIH